MDYRFANQTIFTHTTGQIAEARDEVYIVAGNNLVAEKYVESTNTWESKIILLVWSVRTKNIILTIKEEVSRMNTVVKYLWYTEFGMASMLNKSGKFIDILFPYNWLLILILGWSYPKTQIFTFGGMYGDDIDHIWESGIY